MTQIAILWTRDLTRTGLRVELGNISIFFSSRGKGLGLTESLLVPDHTDSLPDQLTEGLSAELHLFSSRQSSLLVAGSEAEGPQGVLAN